MQKLSIATDGQTPLYAPNLAGNGDIYNCVLSANTATQLAVPSGARIAVFGFANGYDYYVSSSTFSIPSNGSFTSGSIYLNPPPLSVENLSNLYFNAPISCPVTVAFYS